MSALPPEADMLIVGINVCYVPIADIGGIKRTCRGRVANVSLVPIAGIGG